MSFSLDTERRKESKRESRRPQRATIKFVPMPLVLADKQNDPCNKQSETQRIPPIPLIEYVSRQMEKQRVVQAMMAFLRH